MGGGRQLDRFVQHAIWTSPLKCFLYWYYRLSLLCNAFNIGLTFILTSSLPLPSNLVWYVWTKLASRNWRICTTTPFIEVSLAELSEMSDRRDGGGHWAVRSPLSLGITFLLPCRFIFACGSSREYHNSSTHKFLSYYSGSFICYLLTARLIRIEP